MNTYGQWDTIARLVLFMLSFSLQKVLYFEISAWQCHHSTTEKSWHTLEETCYRYYLYSATRVPVDLRPHTDKYWKNCSGHFAPIHHTWEEIANVSLSWHYSPRTDIMLLILGLLFFQERALESRCTREGSAAGWHTSTSYLWNQIEATTKNQLVWIVACWFIILNFRWFWDTYTQDHEKEIIEK